MPDVLAWKDFHSGIPHRSAPAVVRSTTAGFDVRPVIERKRPLICGPLVKLPGIEPPRSATWTPYRSAAALSLVTTALTVAGYQVAFFRAVRMPSAISPSAIA
jgi:hypothetical protein